MQPVNLPRNCNPGQGTSLLVPLSQYMHSAQVEIGLGGAKMEAEVIMVSSVMTAEAILGLNFLLSTRLTSTCAGNELYWVRTNRVFPSEMREPSRITNILLRKPEIRPPFSDNEVMAMVNQVFDEGTWNLEGLEGQRTPAFVARALVSSNSVGFPVRLLNPRSETV